MNYIKELKAFKEWLLVNELPTGAIVLWYTLMAVNNMAGWKSRFNAPNPLIQQLTGLSKQGLTNARTKLMESNLIGFEKGNKVKAPVYKMVSLVNSVDQSLDQSASQHDDQFSNQSSYPNDDQSDTQGLTIPKQKQKQKQKLKQNRRETREENPFTIYQENFGVLKPLLQESLIAWCDDLGDDIVIAAMKQAAKSGGRTFGYVEQILREWTHAKLKNLEQVSVYERQKRTKKEHPLSLRGQQIDSRKAMFDALRKEGADDT